MKFHLHVTAGAADVDGFSLVLAGYLQFARRNSSARSLATEYSSGKDEREKTHPD